MNEYVSKMLLYSKRWIWYFIIDESLFGYSDIPYYSLLE